ncbi:c-type cytochrome [Piscinibacter koreensis]|uniref:Cytochrome c n=1 Tax=Piscinibacter koreensis TaxID=2742824 RepID=A0A7Y6TYP2_9BURK|nr:cytochrome c [Schlegelella koreensis]NUZ08463.1 cytochrome c [Schlegelella koreensis]
MRSALLLAAFGVVVQPTWAGVTGERAERIEPGRRIYEAQCAACHGLRAEGQLAWERPNADGELPAPPHDRSGHTWKHSDAMLYRIVAKGWRDPFNKTQRLTMPAFEQTLTAQEIHDVIEYLKTQWTPKQRAFQREESRRAPVPTTVPALTTERKNR